MQENRQGKWEINMTKDLLIKLKCKKEMHSSTGTLARKRKIKVNIPPSL